MELDQEASAEVEDTVRGIIGVVERDEPPELEKKPYCDACLYQDICWV